MDDFDITFHRKKVKHYSIRIDGDGTVHVTVPFSGTMREAERFVKSKAGWILKKRQESLKRIPLDPATLRFHEGDAEYLTWMTEQIYPLFSSYRIPFPKLSFRVMKGRWGSCTKKKAEVTLNKLLKLLPKDCQEYVIAHELSHLVEANHSKAFYEVLSSVLPDYRERERKLDHFWILRPEKGGAKS